MIIISKTDKVPYSRRFTWEALARYVASSSVGDESIQQHHWKSQNYQCGVCTVDYDIVTHLEEAERETRWILRDKKLSNLTHLGHQYTHQEHITQIPDDKKSATGSRSNTYDHTSQSIRSYFSMIAQTPH